MSCICNGKWQICNSKPPRSSIIFFVVDHRSTRCTSEKEGVKPSTFVLGYPYAKSLCLSFWFICILMKNKRMVLHNTSIFYYLQIILAACISMSSLSLIPLLSLASSSSSTSNSFPNPFLPLFYTSLFFSLKIRTKQEILCVQKIRGNIPIISIVHFYLTQFILH